MSDDAARAGVPSRAASQPAAAAPAAAGTDRASDDGEVLEKAYVAPQVLPKAALPTTPAPDAKVVLNLPASAVGAVSEEEVRAARARRRTATVKIDRAALAETLGPDLAAAVGPVIAPPRPARRRSDAVAPPVEAPLLPDGDDATPVDRHRQLGTRPAPTPAPVATSRELEPSLDAAYTPPKSRSGLLVALGAVAVLGVGAWLLVAGAGPASTSSDPTSPTARSPEAPAAPQSTAAAARPTEAAAPPTAEAGSPSTAASTAIAASSQAATSQATPSVSTAATKPSTAAPAPAPAPAPRPVAKPVARPPKQPKGDIPSEI